MDKKRIAISLVFSIIFLSAVFYKVPVREVLNVLKNASPFWMSVAVGVMALTITLTGVRWDQVLRSQNWRLPFWQVIRATWYGHCFNTALLGPAAGDIFKSTLFAKEQNMPLVNLLSASWLDRLLAGVGSVIFAVLVVIFTLMTGEQLQIELPSVDPWIIVAGVLCAAAVCFLIWKFRLLDKIAFVKKLKDTFAAAVVKMYKSPGRALTVILLGCVGQILLSSILAWTLASVTQTDLPWMQMLWVFPVIAMLATLPISVGGVGIREGASLVLLGNYGVVQADAVAASLLCLGVYWLNAAIGAILLFVGKPAKKQT